jgi:hypothetical protein
MRTRLACALLCATLAAGAASAREFEVRLLKGKPESGVWGTSEFSVEINRAGVLRHVKLGDREIVWQAAALYTRPYTSGMKRAPRTVQGEGFGKRGLTLEPPKMTIREERGRRIFELEHIIANKQVYDGSPLCKADQKVVIAPNGEIHVTYDFEWLRTVRWSIFSHLVRFDTDACRNREYLILIDGRPHTGVLKPGPVAECRIRHKPFDRLTVYTEPGPIHFVWPREASCTFQWSKTIGLHIGPAHVSRRGYIYKGLKDTIAYSILLPVPQQ